MLTLVAFAVILIPVIVFHEFGHFVVAKLSGIFVKTFSVGFGPKLLKFRFGETQYALSAVPFGGYVKMAGDSVGEETPAAADAEADPGAPPAPDAAAPRVGEAMLYSSADEVPDAEIPTHRYFRNKPLLTRLAVVTAGPIANYILAVVVMTGVFWKQGRPEFPTTTLGQVEPDSPAASHGFQSGDVITQVGGVPVHTSSEAVRALRDAGDAAVPVGLRRAGRDTTVTLSGAWATDGEGDVPQLPFRLGSRVGLVKRDGPADKAGLREGDRIVEVDGKPVAFYDEVADVVNGSIGRELAIVWERDGARMSGVVVPEGEDALVPGSMTEVRKIGRIQIEPYQITIPIGFTTAARASAQQCWMFMRETLRFLGLVVSGKASRDAIGGPIRIAQESGSAARWGATMLFYFMAFLSVNLCLLNLLPIPVLDGGHVLFLVIEAVRGEALSVRAQELMLRVGVSALILLMGFVVINDIIRMITG